MYKKQLQLFWLLSINVDIIKINEFAPGNDEQEYENLIYSKKSSKLDLIESGDNFLLYNIDKEYDKDPDLSDEKINSKIRELVYQTGKFNFNRDIIEEILPENITVVDTIDPVNKHVLNKLKSNNILNKSKNMSSQIPFGPYIILGCVMYLLLLDQIIKYLN